MDKTVQDFYIKNAATEDYATNYINSHRPRCKWVMQKFGIDQLKNQRIIGFGEGMGNNFEHLDQSNYLINLDGAILPKEKRLCNFLTLKVDLDDKYFGQLFDNEEKFDVGIMCEVYEHLQNDYQALVQIKNLIKENGILVMSVPGEKMWHNVLRPGQFWPKENFEVYLRQMAFEIVQYEYFDNGWPSHCWKLKNLRWEDSQMVFPKQESKFIGKTPLEYTNL